MRCAGRLREVQDRTTGGGTAVALSARYTADGERIEKTDPFTGTKLSSFGLFDTKTKGGNTEGTLHTPGISFRKGLDVSGGTVGTTGTDRFFHTDQLGSTRHLTDGTGTGTHSTTPSRMRFDAYGLPTQLEGADGWDATEYQYAGAWGYEREPNGSRLGLDYLYQRYYDPAVGKFISADPIGIAGGLNLYAYCENDPVNAVDPSGLSPGDALDAYGIIESSIEFGADPNWVTGSLLLLDVVTAVVPVIPGTGARHAPKILKRMRGVTKLPSARPGVRYLKGKPVRPDADSANDVVRMEWALRNPIQRIERTVEKYGINLRARGKTVTVRINPNGATGNFGKVKECDPTTIWLGPEALKSEEAMATTIAHELRHVRQYLDEIAGVVPRRPKATAEKEAEASEQALREFIRGVR